MSVKDNPRQGRDIPMRPGTTTPVSPATGRFAAAVRIVMGLVFLRAFLDKAFRLGYATPGERAWIDGGSPTKGFLGGIDHGPFAAVFRGWTGAGWADTRGLGKPWAGLDIVRRNPWSR